MELEGRLNGPLTLPEVLQFLGMGRMTGTLTCVNGDYSASLTLRQGRLVNSSSVGRPRRLGQMLINRGLVDRMAVEEALAYQQDFSPETPLGRILVHRGHITMDQLRHAIRLQLEEELWDLFSMREGSYKFEHGSMDAVGIDSVVELDVEPLILEGTRRLDEWSRIVKNIPGDSAIPSIMSTEEAMDREMLHFSDSEWRVLSLVNGTFDMGCIAARSGLGKFETFRVINSFLASGLVVVRMPAEPVPAMVPLEVTAERMAAIASSARADDPDRLTGGSSARLSAIFSRWREGESSGNLIVPDENKPPLESGALSFASPVSFVTALCNRILAELMRNPDFILESKDEKLAERYWRQIVMDFPRADLLSAEKNVLNADMFDRYLVSVGVEGPMKPIYSDTMEALSHYLRTLYLLSVQRLGIKSTKGIFANLLENYKRRSKIDNAEDFFFNEFAARALA